MHIAITEGVLIRVKPQYIQEYSDVENKTFFFKYHIEIENHNPFPIQLLHRDWYVFDALNLPQIISGEGVVGEQPVLRPNEKFCYNSGCELNSEIGYMTGHYTFKNLETNELFPARIPRFELYFPAILN